MLYREQLSEKVAITESPEDFEDECMNGRDSDDESPDPNDAPNIDPYF